MHETSGNHIIQSPISGSKTYTIKNMQYASEAAFFVWVHMTSHNMKKTTYKGTRVKLSPFAVSPNSHTQSQTDVPTQNPRRSTHRTPHTSHDLHGFCGSSVHLEQDGNCPKDQTSARNSPGGMCRMTSTSEDVIFSVSSSLCSALMSAVESNSS